MIVVDVAHAARAPLSDVGVRRIIAATVRRTGRTASGAISVAFVGPARMRWLNRTYHGEDRVTDVLAFGEAPASHPHALFEIIICPSYVRRQAERAGESFTRELTRVLIHGTLHLFGYDHAKPKDAERMFTLQEGIVRAVRR